MPRTKPRAGFIQIAKTIFFGLLMIGKKETWEKGGDGARMTSGQIVAGAIVGGLVVIGVLLAIVRVAIAFATR